MNRYREYFIGGPLDGRDKTTEFPNISEWGVVQAIEFTGEETITHDGTDPISLDIRWEYHQDRFTFGGIRVAFWTDRRYTSRELIMCRLAELILAPHVITESETPNECDNSDNPPDEKTEKETPA